MGYEDEELDEVQALLQAISIEDVTADLANALQMVGFERVRLTKVSELPDHVWEWLGEGWDDAAFQAALEEALTGGADPQYWRVETVQGSFGLMLVPHPILVLDLTGTGVEPFQIDASLDPDLPHKVCLVQSEDTLSALREVMEFDRELERLIEDAEDDSD